MIQPPLPYTLRPMQLDDLPRVMCIEDQVFPTPWPQHAYEHELTQSLVSHCVVLEGARRRLLGYGCIWVVVDEVHLSTLAVAPGWRGRGCGELLLHALIDQGLRLGGRMATLEVRVSNLAARELYVKYGFVEVGRRPRYYSDNDEDALIMTVEPLDDAYADRLIRLRLTLFGRLAASGRKKPAREVAL